MSLFAYYEIDNKLYKLYTIYIKLKKDVLTMCQNANINCGCNPPILHHVHNFEGMVELSGDRCCPHHHSINTVTSRNIPSCDCNHYHEIEFRTSINCCHCHTFCGRTGLAIQTTDGNHIHLLESCTSRNDCHKHGILISTGIEIPVRC